MQLTLVRDRTSVDGVFGRLMSYDNIVAYTLEHAFPGEDGYSPAVPAGTYECVKGLHYLEGASSCIMAFEVTKVLGHTGILFHIGNTNSDSSGCILVGQSIQGNMLMKSRLAFRAFMDSMLRYPIFTLVVS